MKECFDKHPSVMAFAGFTVYFALILVVAIYKGDTAAWVVGIVIPVGIVSFGLGWELGRDDLEKKK